MEASGRLFLCARCRVQVLICSPCDRGQIYCAGDCSQLTRRASVREAGRRYQRSRKGRFAHAERSRRYRQRHQNVTHQGSLSQPCDDLLPADSAVAIAARQACAIVPPSSTLRCHWCGVRCSAFVRLGYLGHRVSRNVRQHDRRGPHRGHPP
jgi:hypothetical protein